MRSFVTEFGCVVCGGRFAPGDVTMTCPSCGIEGILDISYDLDAVRAEWKSAPLPSRPHAHWRYRELLPLDQGAIPDHWAVGWTPIVSAPRLAAELGLGQLLFKDEGRNPTASFKDRASAVGVAHAVQQRASTIACASTGNAATSLAGHAALAGLPAVIFVPADAPQPKLAQLLVYGATVIAVDAPYDRAYDLCTEACDTFGWYNRNCGINPVLVEGKKTGGMEIAEQSGAFGGVPDWVAVSVGDGCTIAAIWKGLVHMRDLGVIDRLPRLLGAQAEGAAPIAHACRHDGLPRTPTGAGTLADSINVPVPRNWRKAVKALHDADGVMTTVTDDQILGALRTAGGHGMFAEPAAAASLAGVVKAVDEGLVSANARVLAVMTGSGLKDTHAAIRAGGEPIRIQPEMQALSAALERRGVTPGRA